MPAMLFTAQARMHPEAIIQAPDGLHPGYKRMRLTFLT